MQSKAADVEEYLKDVPADRLPALRQLRALCLEMLPGFSEGIEYGMPCYQRDGVMGAAWASQKGYIALYGMGAANIERHKHALAGCDLGKGCIRFRKPSAMDFDLIRTMMRDKIEAAKGEP